MQKLKVGIVGCGGIANRKHLPALAKLPEVEMVAFCDIIPERAVTAAKEYGIQDAKTFSAYREMLALPLDVVHVLTPNSSHAEITIAALEAGAHVMCEKPMSITSEEGKRMCETAKRTGKKLTIGYQNRFRQDALHLKKCCEAGDLGEIYYARAQAIRRRAAPTWGVFLDEEKQGGGPLIDIGTHALDLTLWCMDNYRPKLVVGTSYHKLGCRPNSANKWGPWDPAKFTVEDSAFGFVRMENGATVIVESSWALNTLDVNEAKTLLCGTEGGADMLGVGGALRINGENHSGLFATELTPKVGGLWFPGIDTNNSAEMEARMWINHLLDDSKPLLTTPEQALVVTQILEAIYRSAASGEPVRM